MLRGRVTSVVGTTVSVEVENLPGFSIGPVEACVSTRAYLKGDRVLVAELAVGEYVVVGRLP